MATLSSIVLPNNVTTATNTQTLTNKTLQDALVTLGGTNGNAGQAIISKGSGVAPEWGTTAPDYLLMAQGVV